MQGLPELSWPLLRNLSLSTNSSNFTDLLDDFILNHEDETKFILPLWRQVLWSLLFGCMIIVATGGNIIVIWIVLAHKRMRTVTNYFLVNLSIADTTVSTLNVIFNFIYMLNSHWPFGDLYCRINPIIAVITVTASVYTLMAISIDRYMAIVNPLKPRMGKRATLCVAMTIWVVSVAMSLPNIWFYQTESQNLTDGNVRTVCFVVPDEGAVNAENKAERLYNVCFMILTYFLPIGAMCFTYARIGLELWGSQSIGEATQRQIENIRNKRRVVKMMMIVVVIFAVCWLPYHIWFIVISLMPHVTTNSYAQEVYLAIYWLAMSNSMYNPMIYCWMNSKFRRGFLQFFSWCPGVKITQEPALARSEALTSRYSCVGSPDSRSRFSRNGTTTRFALHHRPQRQLLQQQPTVIETTTTLAPAISRRESYIDAPQQQLDIELTKLNDNLLNRNGLC
ncbi:hypothetical protein TKK_0016577 [Trichogramma kaykai]|uniref:G-protein coupled receptors family 1 profile domain-containing protein n=1 Tax=Trichogramma kaykai TaxID=54128 RepID=A0ABD2W622_9HYME